MKQSFNLLIVAFALVTFLASCGGGNKAKTGDGKDSTSNATGKEAEGSSESSNSGNQDEGSSQIDPKMVEVIETYCEHFSSYKYEKVKSLFANDVKQYISMKNTNGDAVGKEAKRFLSKQKFVNYYADIEDLKVNGKTASVPINIEWAGHRARVLTEIEFNDDYKIVSFREAKVIGPKFSNLQTTDKKIKESYKAASYEAYLQLVTQASSPATKDAINNFIFKSVGSEDPSEAGIRKSAKDFIAEYKAIAQNGGNTMGVYSTIYARIKSLGKYATASVVSEGYAGGAHGYSSVNIANFDTQTGKQLTLADVMVPNYESELKKIATKIFRRQNNIPDDKTINQYGYTIDDNEKLVFAKSFAFKKDYIEFSYGRYEAGPYVMPPPTLNIKYSEIKDLIKKNGVLGDKVK